MEENNPWKEWKLMVYIIEEYFSNKDVYIDTANTMKNYYTKVIDYLDTEVKDDVVRCFKKAYVYDNLISRLSWNSSNSGFIQDMIDLSDENNLSSPGLFLEKLQSKQEKVYNEMNNQYRSLNPELVQERVDMIFKLYNLHTDVFSGIDTMKQPSNLRMIKKGLILKELIAKFKGLVMALDKASIFNPYINVLENEVKNINQIIIPVRDVPVEAFDPRTSLRMGTCFNLATNQNEEFINFLYEDDDNIVISYNDNIECNNREIVLRSIVEDIVETRSPRRKNFYKLYNLYGMIIGEPDIDYLSDNRFSLYSFENIGDGFYRVIPFTIDDFLNF